MFPRKTAKGTEYWTVNKTEKNPRPRGVCILILRHTINQEINKEMGKILVCQIVIRAMVRKKSGEMN